MFIPESCKTYPARSIFQHIITHPVLAPVLIWLTLARITESVQLTLQAFSFAGCILVIRLLITKDYDLNALASTMLG
ncbi:hypothetical protein ACFQ48_05440 [Hymenobacter caeli]|uniref:Uncharacterized protein n=1 Tax=Hymenobacter caeli TaxID=2735894 RepID=A0ABX2FQK7_9BACT|nr:hypothetical protein [Hymenobacter caeli]NRT18679.1 hypothetical protein [Hymenobacter caeli]